jgi:hypothetical protein
MILEGFIPQSPNNAPMPNGTIKRSTFSLIETSVDFPIVPDAIDEWGGRLVALGRFAYRRYILL